MHSYTSPPSAPVKVWIHGGTKPGRSFRVILRGAGAFAPTSASP